MSRLTQLRRSLAAAAVLCAFAAPAAGAAQDLRSPDTRDAVTRAHSAPEPHGLRSPDTSIAAAAEQDLRAPDTRDAASGSVFGTPAPVWPVTDPAPSPAPVTTAPHGPNMLPWLLGAGLALLGGAVAMRHGMRRRHVAV